MKNCIPKSYIIFLTATYVFMEAVLYYLFPIDLSYKYLKLTNFGIFYAAAVFLPLIAACISIIFYKKFHTNFFFLILVVFMMAGIAAPLLSTLYPVTVSETSDINAYKSFDHLESEKKNIIAGYLPGTLPEDNAQMEYHYYYAKEGFQKGLKITLELNFTEKTDFLNWKQAAMDNENVQTKEIMCETKIDDASQIISYFIEY